MVAKYYLSDLHLDHKGITKFRTQFSSSKEHDELIKHNYHKVVRPNDLVTFCGDVAMSPKALEDLKKWNGIKTISLGNHDNAEFKKRGVSLAMLQEVFEDRIHGFFREHEFWISHCPIHPDELRNRFNLHGHIHHHIIDDPRYLNLCMEHIDYTPISLEQIRAIFKNRGF